MSASRHKGRRRGGHGDAREGGDERWLLTYADLITLLMALFVILWAVSSVNTSKFDSLKDSLHQAFKGQMVDGSQSLLSGERSLLQAPGAPATPVPPSSRPLDAQMQRPSASAAAADQADVENLQRLQQELNRYARAHHLEGKLRTSIDERGLVIRLLTDDLLFDSGQAVLRHEALPVLGRIATLLAGSRIHNPVRVEGNTDDVPISTAQFRSNWELSTGRSTAVLLYMLARGLPPERASVAGYADQRPVVSNETAAGRSVNRRVELVVVRRAAAQAGELRP